MAYNTKSLLTDASGSKPIAQFYDPTADAFDPLTGVPLGGGRYGSDNLMWGKTTGGIYVPVQVDANGVLQTAFTGRNAIHLATLFNALAITDTTYHYSSVLTNLDGYKNLYLIIRSTLNQALTAHFYGQDISTIYASGSTDITLSIPVPTVNRVQIATQNDIYGVLGISLPNFMVGVSAATAPTSGSITMDIYGTPQ